ncbi:MAG: hypothetical protein GWP19_08875 [Planctomycetia bacterium]|nr:hypothetical protein [Planctomycetia bacterium]
MNIYKYVSLLILLILFGCTNQKHIPPYQGKTCVVLSVGGMKGLAHIGAIDAIRKKGIKIDYIYGNSMGSVIGGVYAHSPDRDLKSNVESILRSYVANTEKEYESKATSGFLFGATLAFLSGGTLGWGTILGSSLLNATSVEKFDNNRFRSVMDEKFNSSSIENLKIPFATSYQTRTPSGFKLNTISSGNLARAISRSANNPFIFKNTSLEYIDPGLDRFSATPIEDAIKHFKPDNVIAINVTGQPAVYNNYEKCKVIEIVIEVDDIEINDLNKIDQIFESYYIKGYEVVNAQL